MVRIAEGLVSSVEVRLARKNAPTKGTEGCDLYATEGTTSTPSEGPEEIGVGEFVGDDL